MNSPDYARTIEVHRQQIPWTVDDRGVFSCQLREHRITAASLAELETKAREIATRTKVRTEIIVTLLGKRGSGPRTQRFCSRDAILTGIHGRSREVTVRFTDEGMEAATIIGFTDVYRPFTNDEHEEYARLVGRIREAEADKDQFLAERKMDKTARQLVEEEIEKALSKEPVTS